MKKVTAVLILTWVLGLLGKTAFGQDHIVDVIDTPTASSVDLGSYALSFRLYDRGSIQTRLFYGIIMRNLTLGLSFDTENVVGKGDVTPRRPYLYVKLPLYTGDRTWPAISLGFDEQGYGVYNEETEEYQFGPMGFFLVLTKMGLLSGLNLGAGINTDYETGEERQVKGFVNADFTMGPEFMLLSEVKQIGKEGGYCNAGFRYMLNMNLNFEFAVLNIGGAGEMERILRVTYTGSF